MCLPLLSAGVSVGVFMEQKYDLIIIGAGPGGYVAALRGSQSGLKTLLIEKDNVGGMCLNWGCIPSKSLLSSAALFDKLQSAEKFGIDGIDLKAVKPNWNVMNSRSKDIVKKLTGGVKTLLDKNKVTTLTGEAIVIDSKTVKVNETEYKTDNLIIATGSYYELPEFAGNNFYTPKTFYSMEKLPESVTIIGSGSVGIELALLFSLLNVKTEIVEKSEALMSYMDDDLIAELTKTLKKNKIKLHLGYEAISYNDGLLIKSSKNEKVIKTETFIYTPSRKPYLKGIEPLFKAGLELTEKGFIKTDLRCRTTLPNVYAIGDINGRFMLAHVASVEGTCAVDTILGQGKDLVYDMMPYNMYAKPEFASVGMTEKAAKEKGFLVETGKFPFAANGKALAEGNSDGFVKVVYDKKYGEILGVHIVAENATDLIGESVMAMQLETTVYDVAVAVHPHPTLVETFLEATFKAMGKPLHTL